MTELSCVRDLDRDRLHHKRRQELLEALDFPWEVEDEVVYVAEMVQVEAKLRRMHLWARAVEGEVVVVG